MIWADDESLDLTCGYSKKRCRTRCRGRCSCRHGKAVVAREFETGDAADTRACCAQAGVEASTPMPLVARWSDAATMIAIDKLQASPVGTGRTMVVRMNAPTTVVFILGGAGVCAGSMLAADR